MKPPQERKTDKVIKNRPLGEPNIYLIGTDGYISLYEAGEEQFPPVFRGREEIEMLRDYAQAWLDYHDEHGEEGDG